jgi:putative Mg2+ transporter-C (MgtC) family protein
MELTLFDITTRIILAAFLGGIIGLERQVKGKVAGLRTTMLICTGAALFMVISELVADRSGDKGRIAAQVVTGIGFLGAGAILHRGAGITGLTTAATIFAVAAIGLAAGAGFWAAALITTIIVIFTLFPLGKLELRIHTSYQTFHYDLNTTDVVKLMQEINSLLAEYRINMEDVTLNKRGEAYRISFHVTANPVASQAVMRRILATGTVASVTAPSSSPVNDNEKEHKDT